MICENERLPADRVLAGKEGARLHREAAPPASGLSLSRRIGVAPVIAVKSRNGMLLLVALLLTAGGAVCAQSVRSGVTPESIRLAVEQGDSAMAERLAREFRRRAPAVFAGRNIDYLLGRLLERRAANTEARALYREVVDRRSVLAGFALRRLAGIARSEGRMADEQSYLRRLLVEHPAFLRRDQLARRLSDSYSNSGQYPAAIEALGRFGVAGRESLARIAEAQAGAGLVENAAATFDAVLVSGRASGRTEPPERLQNMDESALRAVRGLDRIQSRNDSPPPQLSEEARLQRARVYQFNRYFEEARGHWQALLRDYPASPARPEALFQLGRGYFLQNNFSAAIEWYEQLADQFPQTDPGEQGFYQVGHCYQGLGDASRAIERYELFLKRYPGSRFTGYACLNAIDTLRTAGRLREALEWVERAKAYSGDQFFAVTAIFGAARIHLSEGNYDAAISDLNELRARSLDVRGLSATTSQVEVEFLRGYCLERLRRYDDAVRLYLSLPEGRLGATGYYGRQATARLRELGRTAEARALIAAHQERSLSAARRARAAAGTQDAAAAKSAATQALRFSLDKHAEAEMGAILRWAYSRLRGYQLPALNLQTVTRSVDPASHQSLAAELLSLGLEDEAGPELAASGATPQTIAWYCARGDCADLTLRYSDPILNALPADYRPELLPTEWRRLFYPQPWSELLARLTAGNQIDPLLLISLARQESGFRSGAVSEVAARGILQFIAPTAIAMANQLRLRDFEIDDLFTVETSLRLGVRYVRNLQSNVTTPAMIASAYNGSEESTTRWIARSRSRELDRHVIEILKRETKDYVFRVMNYYHAYRTISHLSQRKGQGEATEGKKTN